MESKKKEAMKAKKVALERMEMKDFTSAQKFALTAQQLCNDLDKIEQIIMVCNVHSSVGIKNEKDWYKIIDVDPAADMATVKSQCNRLALGLHPDKNAAPGAVEAFQLVMEAKEVLMDYEKRSLYDSRVRISDSNKMKPKSMVTRKKKDEAAKKDDEAAVNNCPFAAIAKGKTAKEEITEGKLTGIRVSGWYNRVPVFQNHKKPISMVSEKEKDEVAKKDDEVAVNICAFNAIAKAKEDKMVEIPSPPKLKVYVSRKSKTVKEGKMAEIPSPSKLKVYVSRKGKTVKEGKMAEIPSPSKLKVYVSRKGKTVKEGKIAEIPSPSKLKVYVSRKGKTVKEDRSVLFSKDNTEEGFTDGKREALLPPKYNKDVKKVKLSQFEGNLKNLEYSDAQFNDFDRERSKKSFSKGQIWAVYDTLDAMPRFYALINDVVIIEDFKVQITWLEPIPEGEDEKRWLCQGLPASFGKFRLGNSETIEDHAIFSHLVLWKKSDILDNLYEIYPKKGETWALFKNWDFDDWIKDQGRHKVSGFEVVEVLSDYFGGFGINVRVLSKIKDVFSGFQLKEGVDWEVVHAKSRFRFSHKIPSLAVTMLEGTDGVKKFFELDPASLPSNM